MSAEKLPANTSAIFNLPEIILDHTPAFHAVITLIDNSDQPDLSNLELTYCNLATLQMLRLPKDSPLSTVLETVPLEIKQQIINSCHRLTQNPTPIRDIISFEDSGDPLHLGLTVEWLTENPPRFHITGKNITDLKEIEDAKKHQFTHDHLTQVLNLAGLEEKITQLADDRRLPHAATVIYFDLDNFGKFNKKYGHSIGNEVLVNFTQHLTKIFRSHDIIARLSGGADEFIVILPDVNNQSEITHLIDRLDETQDSGFIVNTENRPPLRYHFTYGVASTNQKTAEAIHQAINEADKDMLHRKMVK